MSIRDQVRAAMAGSAIDGVEPSAKSFEALSGRRGVNTAIDYAGRDHDGRRTRCRAVFAGEITPAQIRALVSNLVDDRKFLPATAGLPVPRSDGPDEMAWHDLESITLTTAPPTENRPLAPFAREFAGMDWGHERRPAFAR